MNKLVNFFQKKYVLLACSIVGVSSTFLSCKENTILPSSLVPAIDNIYTFSEDTFTVITKNIYQDSILTGGLLGSNRVSNANSFYHALGAITSDPIFGKTHASFHVEVLPPVPNFVFKTDAVGTTRTIDSIVLSIPYKTAYGDTNNGVTQNFKVFRSIKQFSRDSSQFEFTKDSIDYSNLLASKSVNLNTISTDSPTVGNIKLQPQLRFKLASWFADSLQSQIDLGPNGAAATYDQYLNWWRGFAVVADSNVGSTLGFFDTYNTRMYIYYRYTNSSNMADTTVDVFSFDPNYCNRFNTITRNYNGTESKKYLNTGNALGDSILFIQSEPGMATEISFPYLTNLENVVVNRAELTLTSTSPFYNWIDTLVYGITPRLQVITSDTNGTDAILEEYAIIGSSFVDGSRKVVNVNGANYIQYKFFFNNTFQKIISQKNTNFRLKIIGLNSGTPGAGRVLFKGSSSKDLQFKPKMNIIYTKIK